MSSLGPEPPGKAPPALTTSGFCPGGGRAQRPTPPPPEGSPQCQEAAQVQQHETRVGEEALTGLQGGQ